MLNTAQDVFGCGDADTALDTENDDIAIGLGRDGRTQQNRCCEKSFKSHILIIAGIFPDALRLSLKYWSG